MKRKKLALQSLDDIAKYMRENLAVEPKDDDSLMCYCPYDVGKKIVKDFRKAGYKVSMRKLKV